MLLSALAALPLFVSFSAGQDDPAPLSSESFSGLELRNIGPALMSGRITDIAIHPEHSSTWYVAVGSGGVWKTVNTGTTWTPIFEDQTSYSVGCVTIDPNNFDTIWIGSGENVGGRHVGFGDGVYRSLDGGESWEAMGLSESQHIGNIVIDPYDSAVVFVAVQGPLWSPGGERGLYRSVDAGGTWNKVLGGGEYTGVNEVHLDPTNPDIMYASTHQRFRDVAVLVNGGPESGIHKSTDGGLTWRELSVGLPEEDMGRIGLAISPVDPNVVYATIELADRKGGFFRSLNAGESWEKRNDTISGGTGPHYYQEIFASPHDVDVVFQTDVWLKVTRDGGDTFQLVGEDTKHSDNHALAFDPNDSEYLLVGCDGGLYETWDNAATWRFHANLPVTQFYKVAVDYDEPFYNVYGGTQDNSTQGGPSRTDNQNGIRNADWFITLFADGHQPAVDPTNPDIVYSEWQEGNLVRYDRRTGEIVYIQPQPAEGEGRERFNWDAPILISAHDPARLYYASQRVWRSDDRGDSWRALSEDLTSGQDRLTRPVMGRKLSDNAVWDLWAMSKYATVTSLAESPLDEQLLYAGTDDSRIQVSEDGGATWRLAASLPDVPEGFFVNDIKADLHNPDSVFAVVDNHKAGDFRPFLFRSTDRGQSWTSISGDLPERHICWRLVQDHVRPELLFVGTEFGVFFSVDSGAHWIELEGGVPNIPFRDLTIQRRENDLVGASFGRGIFILDDIAPLREVTPALLQLPAHLFAVRDAWTYIPKRTLAGKGKAFQGDAYYVAPNPPFGAVFTYHLRDELQTVREARRDAEGELAEAGQDTPFPAWDALREEEQEQDPVVLLTVRNAEGQVVRHLEAPVGVGLQRVAWDLRFAPVIPGEPQRWAVDDGRGSLVPPGPYSVDLATRVNGVVTGFGEPRTFQVKRLRAGTLPGASPAELTAFLRRLDRARARKYAVDGKLEHLTERLGGLREVLRRANLDDDGLRAELRSLDFNLSSVDLKLHGDSRRGNFGASGPVSVGQRLEVAITGSAYSTYGPTKTLIDSLEIAERGLDQAASELGSLEESIDALEDRFDAAGVPWTPGRSLGDGR